MTRSKGTGFECSTSLDDTVRRLGADTVTRFICGRADERCKFTKIGPLDGEHSFCHLKEVDRRERV